MSAPKLIRLFLLSLSLSLAVAPAPAKACAACFGQSDSPMAHGMNMGIFSLLMVVVFVLGGIASFFIYLAKKSASVATAQSVQTASAPAAK